MTTTFSIDGTVYVRNNDISTAFWNRCRSIVKNWDVDGSRDISGVSISSVRIHKDRATFYCSGGYSGEKGRKEIFSIQERR